MINTIKSNVHNPKFETLMLTNSELEPISFLYIEKNEAIMRGQEGYDNLLTMHNDMPFNKVFFSFFTN